MKITKTMLQTVMWKIKNAKYNSKKESIDKFFKEKANDPKVIEAKQTIREAKEILETLSIDVLETDYSMKQFVKNSNVCEEENSIIRAIFRKEYKKLDGSCEHKDLEFELTLLADASDSMTDLVAKAEEKFKVKIV